MHDPDHHHTIEKLIETIGSKDECLRLGFVGKDDNETLYLTPVGTGFLIDVEGRDIQSIAEAYAAGFEQGHGF